MTTPSNAGGEEKDSSASRASAVGAIPPSGGLGWGNPPRFPLIPTTTSGSSKKARDIYPPPGALERAAVVVENSPDSSGTASPTDFRAIVEDLRPLTTRNPVEPMSVARKDPRPRSGAPMHNSHAEPILRGTPTSRGGVSPGFTGSWQNRQDAEELRTCRQEHYTAQARSKTLEAEVDVLRAQVQKFAKERDVAQGGEAKSRRRVLELENEIAKLEKEIDCPTPPLRDATLAEQHHRRIGERVEKEPHLPELFSQWEKEQMRDYLFFVEGWEEHLDGASNSVPVLTDPKDPNKHLCLDELPSAMAADKKGLEKRFRQWIGDRWVSGGVVEAKMGSNSDTNSGGR